ncbi:MAG: hypothetical protein ACTSXD_13525 [Candidatus Heimdallarchaeaceae archaeon]
MNDTIKIMKTTIKEKITKAEMNIKDFERRKERLREHILWWKGYLECLKEIENVLERKELEKKITNKINKIKRR